jgi:hypothetical protein
MACSYCYYPHFFIRPTVLIIILFVMFFTTMAVVYDA